MFELNLEGIKENIKQWLAEDVGTGDITTLTTVGEDHQSKGIIHVKEDGIICGLTAATLVFQMVDPQIAFSLKVSEGESVKKGTVISEAEGNTRSILMGERLALNLMQRMSGIATQTQSYVKAMGDVSTKLVDTRKTTPGH